MRIAVVVDPYAGDAAAAHRAGWIRSRRSVNTTNRVFALGTVLHVTVPDPARSGGARSSQPVWHPLNDPMTRATVPARQVPLYRFYLLTFPREGRGEAGGQDPHCCPRPQHQEGPAPRLDPTKAPSCGFVARLQKAKRYGYALHARPVATARSRAEAIITPPSGSRRPARRSCTPPPAWGS
jgi:hypothetical protein